MDDLDHYKDLINHQESESQDELADFLRKSAHGKIPFKQSKESIWDQIDESTPESTSDKKAPTVPLWRFAGIAAALALLITLSLLILNKPNRIQVQVAVGETKTELLPDGSKIILNAESSIEYSERQVSLQGEAFFEVSEGENFVVNTPLGNVQVLGTSFNVFARENDFEVSCKTGKVRVSIPTKSYEEVIEAGDIISMKTDTIRHIRRLPELVGKWQSGEFYFDDQPITEVFNELQRQFDVSIEYDEELEQNFSGYFTNKNLENALDMVCLPLGLEYQKTGSNIFAISASTQ